MLLFFFVIVDLHFFISAVIAQIFNLVAELVIPIGIPIKKAKTEIELHPVIESHPVIAEAKILKCSM